MICEERGKPEIRLRAAACEKCATHFVHNDALEKMNGEHFTRCRSMRQNTHQKQLKLDNTACSRRLTEELPN